MTPLSNWPEKETLDDAARSSRSRLVAQDFRHAAQRENEAVADYISRLEQGRHVRRNQGHATPQSVTVRRRYSTVSYRNELPQYPVSTPTVNCLAARNEEKRIAEMESMWKSPEGLSTLSSRPGETKDPAGSLPRVWTRKQGRHGRYSWNQLPGQRPRVWSGSKPLPGPWTSEDKVREQVQRGRTRHEGLPLGEVRSGAELVITFFTKDATRSILCSILAIAASLEARRP